MKIDCANRRMLVLELTGSDMEELDITYDEICVSDKALRTITGRLLNENAVAQHTGQCTSIYAFPDASGGCMMFFIFEDRESCHVFETADASALIDCARALSEKKISFSALYSLSGAYRLVLHCEKSETLPAYEFMTFTGGTAQANVTYEHWTLLCTDNAVQRLSTPKQDS